MKKFHPKVVVSALSLFALGNLLAGCGGQSAPEAVGDSGSLVVHLADAPDPTITSVIINVDRVEAHVGDGWRVINDVDQSIDLMDLIFNDKILAHAPVPSGRGNQIRLFVSSATVTDASGTHELIVPSGSESGIKIDFDFDIMPKVTTAILLDFNVHKSIVKEGNGTYRLKPVIPAVIRNHAGSILASLNDGRRPLANASIKATYTSGLHYPVGTVVNETWSISDGRFKIWALKPGMYTLDVSWIDPNDKSVGRATSVANVQVTADQTVDVGTISVP